FGNVVLADFVTNGTLESIYFAVVLTTGAMVLDSTLTILFRTRGARYFRMVRVHEKLLVRRAVSLIHVLAVALWFVGTLRVFGLLTVTVDWLSRLLSTSFSVGSLTISIGSIFVFLFAVVLSVMVARFVRFILDEDVLPRLPFTQSVSGSISLLANYSIMLIGFILALTAAGIEWGKMAIIFGALGVGIGFGLQNIVNNFISGLILILERPVSVGDMIEVGELLGKVKRIGIRSSTLRTREGAEVIVPNANLISNEVVNWTLSDRNRRIVIKLGVEYGSKPREVLAILFKIMERDDRILKSPAPQALFTGFGDSSLDFMIRFWVVGWEGWRQIISDISTEINDALDEAGIGIPFPQRDLHIRTIDTSVKEVLESNNDRDTS
ncbi:MAG: mechanosensitive ion channel, partial [Candidatus Latescibacterota bacterium]